MKNQKYKIDYNYILKIVDNKLFENYQTSNYDVKVEQLIYLSYSLYVNNRHKDAISILLKALLIIEQTEKEVVDHENEYVLNQNEYPIFIDNLVNILQLLGANLTCVQEYRKSNLLLEEAKKYCLYIKENKFIKLINERIVVNFILLNDWAYVKQIYTENRMSNFLFAYFSEAIDIAESKLGKAKAFEIGYRILNLIKEDEKLESYDFIISKISGFFTPLLKKISHQLFIDLCDEALIIFSDQNCQLIINAAKHTVGFLNAGKNEKYLEKLNPDMVIMIKALVEEEKLKQFRYLMKF